MDSSNNLRVIILAGPNGAGKTTFAREFLPNEADCPVFINADLIAAGISPFDPESAAVRAGRLMLDEMQRCFDASIRFAFETTLSGKAYARHIQRWQKSGYQVKLIFLSLNSAQDAIDRVALRVAQGGHNIPPYAKRTNMNNKPLSEAVDSDIRSSQKALERAAQRAREIAKKSGTHLVINQDGKTIHIDPETGAVIK